MGKNKNKRARQNSSSGNKFGAGPFNKKFKQDTPMNNGRQNQEMKKGKGDVNGGNKFGNRLMNEKSAGSNKFGSGPFNKKFKQDKPVDKEMNHGMKKGKGDVNGGNKFEKRLVNEKSAFSKKDELVQSPDKKKVKFETLSDSSGDDVELNDKSNITFDESGSIEDSDMEDESFEDEDFDDSLMDEEDDSLSLDEEKNEENVDFSKGVGKTLVKPIKEVPMKEEKLVETKEHQGEEKTVQDGYMFYCRSLVEFLRTLPKKKEVEFRMEVEKLKLSFIDEK